MDDKYPNGIRFEGTEGWVFCARGAAQVTASDPNAAAPKAIALDASDPRLLTAPYGPGDTRWPASADHYLNWLEGIASRRDPIAPVDQATRSHEACCAAWIGMKLRRKLEWNPDKEAFSNDAEANAMRARRPRAPAWDLARVMKRAGL
jgi:hypothetical protein